MIINCLWTQYKVITTQSVVIIIHFNKFSFVQFNGFYKPLVAAADCFSVVFPQCSVGHRDRSAGHHLLRSQRRRDESLSEPGLQELRIGGLRRHLQTLGHPRRHVQAVLYRSRLRHQRRLCECNIRALCSVTLRNGSRRNVQVLNFKKSFI